MTTSFTTASSATAASSLGSSKGSISQETTATTQPLPARSVEIQFLALLEKLQSTSRSGGLRSLLGVNTVCPEIVFVFDELDKLEGEFDRSREGNSTTLGRGRSQQIHKVLGELKGVLSSGASRFLFIGGRGLHDEWLADQSSRRPLLTSIFDAEIYLPSLLNDPSASPPVLELELEERQVDELSAGLERNDAEDLTTDPTSAESRLVVRAPAALQGRILKILNSAEAEEQSAMHRDLSAVDAYVSEHLTRARILFAQSRAAFASGIFSRSGEDAVAPSFAQGGHNHVRQRPPSVPIFRGIDDGLVCSQAHEIRRTFYSFLTYRSRGDVKRLKELLESFLRPTRRYVPSPELRESQFRCDHVLGLTGADIYRLELVSSVHSRLQLILDGRREFRDDKLTRGVYYISDFLLKFHRRAFTHYNLERIDELVHIHRSPDLRQVLRSLVTSLSESFLQEISNGLYDFRFQDDFASELRFLARVSEEELAAVNFTLDESQTLKAAYRQRTKEEGYVDNAIALGELHEYDEEFESARNHYRTSIRLLDRGFPAARELLQLRFSPEEAAYPTARPREVLSPIAARRRSGRRRERRDPSNVAIENGLLPWGVGRVRLMLLVGMTYERTRDSELAQAEYGSAAALARRIRRELTRKGFSALGTSIADRLNALKNLPVLFQPAFAEAWLSEKSRAGVDTGPALVEAELQHLRDELPFVSVNDLATLPEAVSGHEVAHSTFAMIVAGLHSKAGDLYFLKGRGFGRSREGAPLTGYLRQAQRQYAVSLHEIRRFSTYRRKSSRLKLDPLSDTETLSDGQAAESPLLTFGRGLIDLAECFLGQVSVVELATKWPESTARSVHEVSGLFPETLGRMTRSLQAWMSGDEQAASRFDAEAAKLGLFGSDGRLDQLLGLALQEDTQLVKLGPAPSTETSMWAAMVLGAAGARQLELAGYRERASTEYFRIARSIERISLYISIAKQVARNRVSLRRTLDTATKHRLGLFAAFALRQGTRLQERNDVRHVGRGEVGSRFPLSHHVCAISLGIQYGLSVPSLSAAVMACATQAGDSAAHAAVPRARLFEKLDRLLAERMFPLRDRIYGLSATVCLETFFPSSGPLRGAAAGEAERRLDLLEELQELDELYDSPSTVPEIDIAIALYSGIHALQGRAGPRLAKLKSRVASALEGSLEATTMRRSYYERISERYFLFDDFNDRSCHHAHAMALASRDLAHLLLRKLTERRRR